MKNSGSLVQNVKSQYPQPISEWGLPQGIDGALQWENGRTYFFKSGITGGMMTELLVLILHLLLFLDLQGNGGLGVQIKMYKMYKTV